MHVERFHNFLMQQPRNWAYIGQMYDANAVTRDSSLKWYLTHEEWPHDQYVGL